MIKNMTDKQMREMNQWFADECHIEDDFDITDPRCREIVREKFRICTSPTHPNMFYARAYRAPSTVIQNSTRAKTIESAELACLVAIYEGREK